MLFGTCFVTCTTRRAPRDLTFGVQPQAIQDMPVVIKHYVLEHCSKVMLHGVTAAAATA